LYSLLVVALIALNVNVNVNAQGCALCEFVVTSVENMVNTNSTDQEVLAFIEQACALLPSPYNTECTNAVAAEGPLIIQWIISQEQPEKVCELLTLCPTTAEVKKSQEVFQLTDTEECTLCKFFVLTAENYLNNNATETEIETALDSICDLVPGVTTECKALVATYLPPLIQYLEQKENPDTFCSQVGLCIASMVHAAVFVAKF